MESPRTLIQQSPVAGAAPQPGAARRRIARSRASSPAGAEEPGAEDLLLGRYRLLERLGAGGFGVVWRAHDELLHREVAVKRIWLGPGGDSERATREALATARLAHPAIVALYEACAVEDAFYLISELVDGPTLAELIADGELEDESVVEIGLALASALAHAHARGVIHRDIKPHNVLVPSTRADGRADAPAAPAAKLTDFGGASLAGEDALTRTGDVLGTLAYMAPEQSEGREVGEQSDLYSLALVLYEALSGANPVRGATPAATVRRIGRPIESLSRLRRDLPPELLDAIDDALEPRPRDRGSLEDLVAGLESARTEPGPQARRRVRGGAVEQPDERTRRLPARPLRRARLARSVIAEREPVEQPPEGDREQGAVLPAPGTEEPRARERRVTLPRSLWIACALTLIGWQASVGRAGVSLLLLAALLPLAAVPRERHSRRVGAGWLLCALAPALGVAGLAAAFPALAGQARRWRERALYAALGYWWMLLAEPLLAQRLWLGSPSATPARMAWESSLQSTATHVLAPLLSTATLGGALLWATASTVLPWIARGRSAALDGLAALAWSVGLVLATPALLGALAPGGETHPRALLLGALLGGLGVVAARALRGPV